jgi:nitroreductase
MDIAQWRLVVGAAELAPSVHNTQPWRFVVRGEEALEVRADWDRQLQSLDRSGRQLRISCGAAVEYARLSLRAMGRDVRVDVLPVEDDPDLLALLTPAGERAAEPSELALVDAMARRHTDRGTYEPADLSDAQMDEWRNGVAGFGVWAHFVVSADDRVVVAATLSDAEQRQAADPSYVTEISRWTHRQQREDGVVGTPPAWPADRVSDMPLRDFSGRAEHPHPDSGEPPIVERDALLVLGTERDDPAAQIAAGRALAWLLLRITVDGLSGQPLGQALDDIDSRLRLAHDLRVVGHPQFLLRIGRGHSAAQSGRRGIATEVAAGPAPVVES